MCGRKFGPFRRDFGDDSFVSGEGRAVTDDSRGVADGADAFRKAAGHSRAGWSHKIPIMKPHSGLLHRIRQDVRWRRSAVILAGIVLTADEGTVFVIDEPERHLHRAIIEPLLSAVFSQRPDCSFVMLVDDGDLDGLVGRFPIRESGAFDCIAKELHCRDRSDYCRMVVSRMTWKPNMSDLYTVTCPSAPPPQARGSSLPPGRPHRSARRAAPLPSPAGSRGFARIRAPSPRSARARRPSPP